MRFLNRLGNVFFAKAAELWLDVRLGDSLCGTLLVSRRRLRALARWRNDFGDFDPFGDFEPLFRLPHKGTGIIDVPGITARGPTERRTYAGFATALSLFRMSMTGAAADQFGSV